MRFGKGEDRIASKAAAEEAAEVEQLAKQRRISTAIIPHAGRLLMRPELAGNPSSSIIIPEHMRDRCMTAIVVAAGAETTYVAGNRVLLGAFTGIKFEVNQVPHLICKNDEVQGIVVGEEVEILAPEM